ncbi:hypothetical protein PsorP6_017143 [Peronosclerospora sorghi]|uniref:Uncharacterized protein n=1 Tax=Peronosclerospora sorghi TaxID=230839 RepID=A0ACC0WEB3_9STRA|nr:hypothetical protein PsorP6_017143 [Peronosclerospora sorghi]
MIRISETADRESNSLCDTNFTSNIMTAVESKSEHTSWKTENPNEARDAISWHAYTSGLKAGAVTSVIAAAAVVSANKYWPAFRNRLGVSGKTALVVSPFLGAFTIVAEKRLVDGARNPDMYLATIGGSYAAAKEEARQLKLWQRGANFLYDHPYRTLVAVGAPVVGGIYSYQHLNKGISSSQQIMHTRIYGQASVVVLLLCSMAFHDYMARRGKFTIEDQED